MQSSWSSRYEAGSSPCHAWAEVGTHWHALEVYSESLDHEVRQFGIRVSVVEPGFTRTKIGQNGQLAAQRLDVYAADRDRVRETIGASLERAQILRM